MGPARAVGRWAGAGSGSGSEQARRAKHRRDGPSAALSWDVVGGRAGIRGGSRGPRCGWADSCWSWWAWTRASTGSACSSAGLVGNDLLWDWGRWRGRRRGSVASWQSRWCAGWRAGRWPVQGGARLDELMGGAGSTTSWCSSVPGSCSVWRCGPRCRSGRCCWARASAGRAGVGVGRVHLGRRLLVGCVLPVVGLGLGCWGVRLTPGLPCAMG